MKRGGINVDRVACFDEPLGNHAINRCSDFGVAEFELGQVVSSFQGLHVELNFLEVAIADQAAILEFDVASEVLSQLVEPCAGLCEAQSQAVSIQPRK